MTNETIEYIIDLINKGEASELIFLRPLSPNVLMGLVWVNGVKGDVYKDGGVNMFFIQNKERIIVAAVTDMGEQDLHVFVHPVHRGNGHLVNALKEVILPYLFSEGRKEQQITFETEQARHHAELVGFSIRSEASAVITPEDIPSLLALSPGTIPPSENQKERIKQRIRMAADLLRMARDDVQTSFGENEVWENLDYVVSDVANEAWSVHDLWQDYEEALKKQ